MGEAAHCEWCYSCVGGPGFFKKAGWASLEKQGSKPHPPSPLYQPLPPGSCPAWVPVLIASDSELLYMGPCVKLTLSSLSSFGHDFWSQLIAILRHKDWLKCMHRCLSYLQEHRWCLVNTGSWLIIALYFIWSMETLLGLSDDTGSFESIAFALKQSPGHWVVRVGAY